MGYFSYICIVDNINYKEQSVFELYLSLEEIMKLSKDKITKELKDKYNEIVPIYNKKVKFQAYTTIK